MTVRSLTLLLSAATAVAAAPAGAADGNPLAALAMQPSASADDAPITAIPLSEADAAPAATSGAVAASSPAPIAKPRAKPAPLRPLAEHPSTLLTADERERYRVVFAAIRGGAWDDAASAIAAIPSGLLTPIARAELYVAKGSPRVELPALVALAQAAPELPEMPQIARLATNRGATELPPLPAQHGLVRLAGPSKRRNAAPTQSDIAATTLAAAAQPLIKGDQPAACEALLDAATDLSADARTEWQQRVAWAYYQIGDDASARRLAALAQAGMGEWAAQADWVQGLAAFRQRDFAGASVAFAAVAARARDPEMTAAGLFWAARADLAAGRPEQVAPRLRTAARMGETFYGLLAGASLGLAPPAAQARVDLTGADSPLLGRRANLKVAMALTDIGERGLADQVLRYEARIGTPAEHESLIRLAAHLQLPNTQIWLAQNGPAGARLSTAMRYPAPGWAPERGWRVDPALVFAHTLQESQFRPEAVSAAGARGLMQVRLGTAQDIARKRGGYVDAAALAQPAANLEYGQSYLEQLRDMPGIGGLLPKVIAAYNAGPVPVARWGIGAASRDPLLYIESIPYWETRGYVAIVLRNYWMYQRQSGTASASLKAMAQGLWPRFPTAGRAGPQTAVRIGEGIGPVASAR